VRRLASSDLILHAGDLVSEAFLAELRALGPPVEAVRGNMDEPRLQALLPDARTVEAGGARIAMIHDAGPAPGREARLLRRFAGSDAVVYGHTHIPQVDLVEGCWILNPGSPTERRRAPAHSMLLLDVREGVLAPPELVTL
jgi:putative phosphoesterase